MNKVASNAMRGVDIVLYVVDSLKWGDDDVTRVRSISGETIITVSYTHLTLPTKRIV